MSPRLPLLKATHGSQGHRRLPVPMFTRSVILPERWLLKHGPQTSSSSSIWAEIQTLLPRPLPHLLSVSPLIGISTTLPFDCQACSDLKTTVLEYCGVIMLYFNTLALQDTVFLPSGNRSPVSLVCIGNRPWVCSLLGRWSFLTDRC